MYIRLKIVKVMKKDKHLLSEKLIYFYYFVILLNLNCVKCLEFIDNSTIDNQILISLNSTASTVANRDDSKNYFNYINKGWSCECQIIDESIINPIKCLCQGPRLLRIPQVLPHPLRELTIAFSGLTNLREAGLRKYANDLRDITLTNLNEFSMIEETAFRNITNLRTVYISHAPKLQYIWPNTFTSISKNFKTLRIIHCGLLKVPNLNYPLSSGIILQLDLEGNQIREIDMYQFNVKAEQLNLDNNAINYIHKYAFAGSEIAKLSLKGNKNLRKIHEQAFAGIVNIQELDLSSTSIEQLPTDGLGSLETLKIENTHTLKQIPSVYNFKYLKEARLTHSFHCCAFKFPSQHDPFRHAQQVKNLKELQERCIATKGYSNDTTTNSHSFVTSNSSKSSEEDGDIGVFLSSTIVVPITALEALCGDLSLDLTLSNVLCYPIPDALNPCEDVMGSNWLRYSVWVVVLLSVLGNVAVLIVLFSSSSDLTVSKFLICNLATADLFMGLYLILVAIMDIHSKGEYFNFAFDWQYGIGCKMAGFLTVFAQHLSIFTLTIITVERWFAITHAIYLNKRIKLRQAKIIMIAGWSYSLVIASLPLFGYSNYSSTSICLPMEARDSYDVAYLVTLLILNGVAFITIVICYAKIYFSLGKETRSVARTSKTSGEMTVAKKMSLLVFTNFACWAPIAFFALTALAGYPLIDVTNSKILLVFFYPLNSCANPYLYAILTSQYRRDFFLLLSKCGFCTHRAQQYRMTYSIPHTNTVPLTLVSRNSLNNSNNQHRKTRASSAGVLVLTSNIPDEKVNANDCQEEIV